MSNARIGVSGSRSGPSEQQQRFINDLFAVNDQEIEVHHGDCVGVDAAVHTAAQQANHRVVIHPPDTATYRAFCKGSDESMHVLSYRERNQAIVDAVDVLLAFPEGTEATFPRSGTWMTIRMAWRRGIPVTVILPNGVRRNVP